MPAVDAWARCADPNASSTNASPSSASCAASFGSFLVSPDSQRVFSSTRISPGSRRAAPRRTSGPITCGAWWTRAPIRSPSRSDTGASDVAGSAPFGRPRCEQATMRAPASRRCSIAGRAARMRASSVTWPFFRGTLKSTRRTTGMPRSTFRSRSVFLPKVTPDAGTVVLEDLLRQLRDAVRVAPLVVVPGHDLHQPALDHHRQRSVEDRRVRRRDDVRRDDRVVAVLEDPGQVAGVGLLLEEVVDLVDGGVAGDGRGEVDNRAGGHWGADREPGELAVQVGQHQADGLGGAARGGYQVDRGGAGAAQVLVRHV